MIATPFGQLFIVAVTIASLLIACDAPQSIVNAPPSPPKPQPSAECIQMVQTAKHGSSSGREQTIVHYFYANKEHLTQIDVNYIVSYMNYDFIKDIVLLEYYSKPVPVMVEAK